MNASKYFRLSNSDKNSNEVLTYALPNIHEKIFV